VKDIEGWITYAHRGKGLDNPQGLVVSRLRAGVPAPEVVSPGAQRRRDYLGQYAEVIKH
jgi:hypothetical protein